jgi:peptide-methionine (S)-S-oxide reductase
VKNPPVRELASSNRTGHTEAVAVFMMIKVISYKELVAVFFASQDFLKSTGTR